MPKLVGWSDILSSHGTERLTNAHKQEIVKTIRRRHYNFTFFDHQNMSYCCPFFDDGCMISLNKKQFDEIIFYYHIHVRNICFSFNFQRFSFIRPYTLDRRKY